MHLRVLTDCIYSYELCYGGIGSRGQLVEITIGKKTTLGIIAENCREKHSYDLKSARVINYHFPAYYVGFLQDFARFNCQGLAPVIRGVVKFIAASVVKSGKQEKKLEKKTNNTFVVPKLTTAQEDCYKKLEKNTKPSLLWGITGSGKTEIVIKKIIKTLAKGQQALVLVPEIAIGEQFSKKLLFYGVDSTLWHTGVKNKSKFQDIKSGDVSVVIGARSALFLPFNNLGFIAVDEEHSKSYQQETTPSYNGRDMALLLQRHLGCHLWLLSATPSVESLHNLQRKLINLVSLDERYNKKSLAKVNFIDPGYKLIAPELLARCQEVIALGQQVIIFCNRRAFAPVAKCKSCHRRLACGCKNYLTVHKKYYQCHRCNKRYRLNFCVHCNGYGTVEVYGFGVDRVANYLSKKINCKVGVFSSDHCYNAKLSRDFLQQVRDGELDIIVGTQMVSKGHNFPKLAMVIVLNTENLGSDYETTLGSFQQVVQVAGRVGRADIPGEIWVQRRGKLAYESLLEKQDYKNFIKYELQQRKIALLPPFSRIVSIESRKDHSNLLDQLVNNPNIFDIFEDTYPKIIFSCQKNNYPHILQAILENRKIHKIKILG
jgi:primosomal protein N' (replication factor Y)